MNKITYLQIKNYLLSNNIKLTSKISDDESFSNLGSIEHSSGNDLTFFNNLKYKNFLNSTKAKACFIRIDHKDYLNSNCKSILVDDPYLCYALVSNLFLPDLKSNNKIDNSSNIDSSSFISKNVQINANVIIKENCSIGNNVIISENSVIGPNVIINDSSLIMSNCVISFTNMGNDCVIQSGSIIGGKGFGFTPKSKIPIKHLGNVHIGNNVDIGSNTTVDRGAINSTIIEDNVRIDNLVQVAHNVKIGKNSIIAAQVGIAGSTKIGENCIIGGQAGIAGHLKIGNNVTIAAKSGVTKDISDNKTIAGFPAIDIKKWKKIIVTQYKKYK